MKNFRFGFALDQNQVGYGQVISRNTRLAWPQKKFNTEIMNLRILC